MNVRGGSSADIGATLGGAHGPATAGPAPRSASGQSWIRQTPLGPNKAAQNTTVHHPQMGKSELYQPGQRGYYASGPRGEVFNAHVAREERNRGAMMDQPMDRMKAHQNPALDERNVRAQRQRQALRDVTPRVAKKASKSAMPTTNTMLMIAMGLLALLLLDAFLRNQ